MRKTLVEDSAKLAGLQIDLLQKMRNGNVSVEHLNYFLNLNFSQREELLGKKFEKEVYLKLISSAETLILDENGDHNATYDFSQFNYVDPAFKAEANEDILETSKTVVEVHELIKDGQLTQIFGSVNSDLHNLCLTKGQILDFIKNHKSWIDSRGSSTLFLTLLWGNFTVVKVHTNSEGVCLSMYPIGFNFIWCDVSTYFSNRFVIPNN